jgi:hypothetical protein
VRYRLLSVPILFALSVVPLKVASQTIDYYEQAYLPASHNWAFARAYPAVDRLFNAFDYGHSILYETLWKKPSAPRETLDVREYGFITGKLLVKPPKVPLDESAIGPGWTLVAPELLAMFEWAHMLHRQVYDVIADERISDSKKEAMVAEVVAYYKSRPALALSSHPKDMALMEGQPYSLAFRQRFPRFNGLIWSYHWLQMTIYEALLATDDRQERAANVRSVTDRFRQMINTDPRSLPSMMPMTPAIAPLFTARFTEAAIIFENLHSLHDVASDIFANPNVARRDKRRLLLAAAAKYRDATSNITSIDEWKQMSLDMGLTEMGGAPPLPSQRRKTVPGS